MELKPGMTLHGFSIDEHEDLPEIDGEAFVGKHSPSGARLLYLKCDDNNKSFAIGFRTPPQDDTGVFHILEHSVLCGSRRFPVKEPFVDLLKGSMQTFLNAMTFSDKTLYPVASTNERDLFNLMDVYLDAVFHPMIYEKRAIFEQEGWHYELMPSNGAAGMAGSATDADSAANAETAAGANAEDVASPAELDASNSTLVYNGVVFNEMKGALSDASSVLYDEMQKALFPDTCYAFESGGKPEAIPTLTYENYLDEHRRHYRTDNSYIILYGNLDIDKALAFLDESYLTPVHAEQEECDTARAEQGLDLLRPREFAVQAPHKPDHVVHLMDTAPENACAACGYVIGNLSGNASDSPSGNEASDGPSMRVRCLAIEVLLDALFGSNEAPLTRALLDAGVAHDISAHLSDSVLQPYVYVHANMPAEDAGAQLLETISTCVQDMLDAGLDKKLVEAALSNMEFQMRERDSGYADGVIDSMTALTGWLYDDGAAIDFLRFEDAFAQLRSYLETDYFERLCSELFCDCEHRASAEVVPVPGHADNDMAERLEKMNGSLSAAEREQIVAEVALLRQLQEQPDSPEAIATLPRLHVSDIGDAPDVPACAIDPDVPLTCMKHSVPTRGIAYAYQYFNIDCLTFEELPHASILALVLGKLDTARHTAAELDTLSQDKLGDLLFYTELYESLEDIGSVAPKLVVKASSLSKNCTWLADLPKEIMLETDFSNTDKILDVLKQKKIQMERQFTNAGHTCATARLKSYYAPAGVLHEQLGNVGFYRFLCELLDDFDQRAQELREKLSDISERIFCDNRCTVSFAGADECYEQFWGAHPETGRVGDETCNLVIPEPVVRNEAFTIPSDVCFAALGWDLRLLEEEYSGNWSVAGRALSLDYLWNEVRVKGGAYGVGFQARRIGSMSFYSYRDPHLRETVERFEKSSSWLADFDPSESDMEGFVVASVSKIDAPVKPRMRIRRQMADYFCKRSLEDHRKTRNEAIATDAQAVRALAPTLNRAYDQRALCVFGDRSILESAGLDLEIISLVG